MNPTEKLNKIREILNRSEQTPDGYIIDHGVYSNLEATLYHIKNSTVIDTIKRVLHQINEIEALLNQPDTEPVKTEIEHHDDDWHHPKVEDKEH